MDNNDNLALKRLVAQEAINIKKWASDEERLKIDFLNLRPMNQEYCIYGQMTGDCYSNRATELLNLCAQPFTSMIGSLSTPYSNLGFSNTPNRDYSALEYFIGLDGSNNKYLIEFLQGAVEEINPLYL